MNFLKNGINSEINGPVFIKCYGSAFIKITDQTSSENFFFCCVAYDKIFDYNSHFYKYKFEIFSIKLIENLTTSELIF